jgi:hypothetical protein
MDEPQWGSTSGDDVVLVGRFPYSHALENTVMFMILCLIAQFTVFSARVRGPAWQRRPGYLLVSVILCEAAGVSIVGAVLPLYWFWDTTVPTQEDHMMLTKATGGYIGFAWLFSFVIVCIMEGAKLLLLAFFEFNDHKKIEKENALNKLADNRRRLATASRDFVRSNSVITGGKRSSTMTSTTRGSFRQSVSSRRGTDSMQQRLLDDTEA